MRGIRSLRQRVGRLERSPRFQPPPPPPSPLQQIRTLAIPQLSDEDLSLIINLLEGDQGRGRALSPSEEAAVEHYNVALEAGARRMGFKSFAHAQRAERRLL